MLVRGLHRRSGMRRLRDLIIPFVALTSGCMGDGSHRLTVVIIGAGSVVGGVRSTPSGLDCALAAGPGGVSRKECSAEFADGAQITLAFVPDGAGQVAQFFIKRADSDEQSCGASPAATPASCQLVLDADETVTVFPTSIPPP
jgi:hypothetical protein